MKDKLKKRIIRAEKKVKGYKEKHGDRPTENYTYHGGWSLGYWEGMLAAYENILDEIEEKEEEVK